MAIKKSGEKRRNVRVFPGRRAKKGLFLDNRAYKADSFFLMVENVYRYTTFFIFRK